MTCGYEPPCLVNRMCRDRDMISLEQGYLGGAVVEFGERKGGHFPLRSTWTERLLGIHIPLIPLYFSTIDLGSLIGRIALNVITNGEKISAVVGRVSNLAPRCDWHPPTSLPCGRIPDSCAPAPRPSRRPQLGFSTLAAYFKACQSSAYSKDFFYIDHQLRLNLEPCHRTNPG